jgi:phosphoglucosamine mutase
LTELGAQVIEIGTKPDGLNINHKVGATSMKAVTECVLENHADLGFALDGDGDRIMLVDHKGNVIDGDQIVYIIARDALKSGNLKGGVVGTVMSNLGLEVALATLGVPFARSKVGDRYVMELLKRKGWSIGGEGSGHVLNLAAASTGDGIVAGLQVLAAMLHAEMTLNELSQGMIKYPQTLINVRFTSGKQPLDDKQVKQAVIDAEKALDKKGRVLLRKSGTEPLIRVMVEANDAQDSSTWAEYIADAVRKVNE